MRSLCYLSKGLGTMIALGVVVVGAAAKGENALADSHRIAVQYADLDLISKPGIEVLYARLAAATERVCGAYDLRDLRARRAWRACYKVALDDALAQLPAWTE